MKFSFTIAQRYLRSKSSQNAINIINFITFLVIVIGSAALFIVLSAFTGLKSFSLELNNSYDPELKATPKIGKTFTLSKKQIAALKNLKTITHYAKELEERVYLTYKDKSQLATLKGVDQNYNTTTGIDSAIYFGNWGVFTNQSVIGIGVFNRLGVPINNRAPILALAPKKGTGSFNPQALSKPYNTASLYVTGVFAADEKLDHSCLFTNLETVQKLLEKNSSTYSALHFKLAPNTTVSLAKQEINAVLGNQLKLLSREELNSTLYKMLNTENIATYLIFTLVLIIALFNLVGAIIMMILDKKPHLKTLYALGANIKQLQFTYFIQGLLIAVVGGLVGVFFGSLLVGTQLIFEFIKITPSIAYPVALNLKNLAIVLSTITGLGILCSAIASSRVSAKLLQS